MLRVVRVLQLLALLAVDLGVWSQKEFGSSQYFGLSVWYLLVIESRSNSWKSSFSSLFFTFLFSMK